MLLLLCSTYVRLFCALGSHYRRGSIPKPRTQSFNPSTLLIIPYSRLQGHVPVYPSYTLAVRGQARVPVHTSYTLLGRVQAPSTSDFDNLGVVYCMVRILYVLLLYTTSWFQQEPEHLGLKLLPPDGKRLRKRNLAGSFL